MAFHDEPQLVYPSENLVAQEISKEDLFAVQIVAYEDQSYILTESGRVLTWGTDTDGLLGREINQDLSLTAQHFTNQIKLKPPKTRCD